MITPSCYPTDPSDRPRVLLRCHVTMRALYSARQGTCHDERPHWSATARASLSHCHYFRRMHELRPPSSGSITISKVPWPTLRIHGDIKERSGLPAAGEKTSQLRYRGSPVQGR
jgi:hypothetical protein